ncbi:hypothetical protein OUZ56_012166 [Daphnia magna]|uniref:Methyltransferase FkbM domain-containing protein n=1 Tax=Daphnia magna TaxID=35525 RepID=A0ABQ9Z279_9CRUS|nr:hypothetical protein OUZ56_012166 [Daphnia magna]
MQVTFNASVGLLGAIVNETDGHQHAPVNSTEKKNGRTENLYKIQCFPLYSMLVAVGRTQVDYFSLDVEGSEYKILRTIPWTKLDITTLTVEWNHVPEGEKAITRLMEENQYIKFGQISMYHSQEVVYVKDFLYDFRQYYD